ncbi:MAG TPA: ribose-phosphate diphosphokinase [Kofleriaceae bacterium]|nr:ribose-phosphate diphosphokinase [Kofleriaceae bacterium]
MQPEGREPASELRAGRTVCAATGSTWARRLLLHEDMATLDLALFALAPSEAFGRAVAEDYGIAVAPHELRRFEDGEHKIRPLASVRGRDVYLLCSLYGDAGDSVNDRLCRALFFAGAARDAGAARITLVAPYLCYARKDRRTNPRDPVTTRYVARLVEAAGIDRVVTVDVHNRAAYENAFRIPTELLEARPLFAARCRLLGDRPLAVVSPDPGGFHRAEALRDTLEQATGTTLELAMLGKHRKGGVVRTEAFVGNVEGRTAVIVDDLIVTGTTLLRAADACRKRGAVAVHAMATHGAFTAGARDVLASPLLDSIVITDTISPERADLGVARGKLTVLSIAPLVARAISTLHHELPMTALLEEPAWTQT